MVTILVRKTNINIIKMRNFCTIVLCVFVIISSYNGDTDVKVRPRKSKYSYLVRCTRRFTPGLCSEPVTSVWTFVFHMQNCTERYGCAQDWRTNRFTTHARCMRRCKPLVDLYYEILSREPQNLSAYMRSQPWNQPARRDLSYDDDSTDIDDDYDQLSSTVEDIPRAPSNILNEDIVDRSEWAITDDIDDMRL